MEVAVMSILRSLAALATALAVAAPSPAGAAQPASAPSSVAIGQVADDVFGQCWQEGGEVWQMHLGSGTDPGFPERAQNFHDMCVALGGAPKFVDQAHLTVFVPPVIVCPPTNGSTIVNVAVSLSHAGKTSTRWRVTPHPGSARLGREYRAIPRTVTIPAGRTSATFPVEILPNRRIGLGKYLRLSIRPLGGAPQSASFALIAIVPQGKQEVPEKAFDPSGIEPLPMEKFIKEVQDRNKNSDSVIENLLVDLFSNLPKDAAGNPRPRPDDPDAFGKAWFTLAELYARGYKPVPGNPKSIQPPPNAAGKPRPPFNYR
jgi:hypothetical protein